MSDSLKADIVAQGQEVTTARVRAQDQLQALKIHLGRLQARIVRLEALGEHVSQLVNFDTEEFDFSTPPALGGPVTSNAANSVKLNISESADKEISSNDFSSGQLVSSLEALENKIQGRLIQIQLLEDLLQNRHEVKQKTLSGLPVTSGWISSSYGYRSDPFSGNKAWHNGVDIAGKKGANVLSVAAGLVTYASEREGYGQLVEITHDGDYVTRYGHNDSIIVKVGDVIDKGQILAKMGSTGRSTGPHTHFEVYKNGRAVDPAKYIQTNIH